MNKLKKRVFIIAGVVLIVSAAIVTGVIMHKNDSKTETFTISGNSMEPTYHDGDTCTINKEYKLDRSDVVVFMFNDQRYIKRVIGLPNDKIYCMNSVVYINGEPIQEDYCQGTTTDFEEITLGEDEFYCLGDNRDTSKDSRKLGRFKTSYIIGEVEK